jgi:DNA end-binding protein Ku
MARATWTGVISFGLVSVPVEMFSATKEHEVTFHQFQKGTSDRIRYQRVNERTGEEVPYGEIVKGADVGDGEYVMLDTADLDSVAPGRSKNLEIHQFVDLDDIDPIFFQKTYYLGPANDETINTYSLLRDAMADTNRAAIATLVMRTKEYLAAIRVDGNLLVLETMYFADEIRDPKDLLNRLPEASRARPQERQMAATLIESLSAEWRPDDYRDTYTDRVKEMIEAKRTGGEVTVAEEAPAATNVIDLMDVLRRSVENARRSRGTPETRAQEARRAKSAERAAARSASSGSTSSAASTAAPTRKSSKPDLKGMSKAELNALARDLNIAGRSSMDKEQLQAAIKKAA